MMENKMAWHEGYEHGYAAAQDEITKLTAERDAAVDDLETIVKHSDPCCCCANYSDVKLTLCMMCDDEEYNGNFEWRGLSLEKNKR